MWYHAAMAMGAVALMLGLWVGVDALAARMRRDGTDEETCTEAANACPHCGQRDACGLPPLR